jgi:ELWxxDGT repeat protein
VVGGVPYLVEKDEEGFTTLYRTDGADGGIVPLRRLDVTSGLVDFKGRLLFSASGPETGNQLWTSDGTPEGTVAVGAVPAGWAGLSPASFGVSGEVAYFISDGIYRTDTTPEGTVRVANVYNYRTTRLTGGAGGEAYFNYSDSLFRTAGTPDGTTFIHSLTDTFDPVSGEVANGRGLLGGTFFFLGDLNGTGRELFKLAETPPAAPADVAVSDTPAGPLVTWRDVPDDEAGFIVERSRTADFASAEPAGWAPPFAESFADPAYLSGTTYYYRVRAYNAAGDSDWALATAPVTTAPPVTVAGRNVFYNGTKFDGPGPGGNEFDDRAIDAGKAALLSGQTATAANVTGFASGINGIMVDLAGLGRRTPGVADFAFRTGTDPVVSTWKTLSLTNTGDPHQPAVTLTLRRGAGVGGSDRVTLVIPDWVIRNTWLEVTVLPGTHTGLAAPDVFYFGNLVGETGDGAGGLRVTALDLGAVKRALNQTVPVTSPVDFNHDGRVNASDLSIAKANLNRSLPLLSAPPQDPAVTATVFPSMDAKDRPTGTRDDEATDLLAGS